MTESNTTGLPDDEASRLLAADLLDLTFHWDTAYCIQVIDGVWYATPLDGRPVFCRGGAAALRLAIRHDYQAAQAGLRERPST